MNEKYYLYARKSTDVEDKQVLSIEAQLVELREYAKRESLHIAAEFVEKKSAKTTGRPIFGKLLAEIEQNGGNILAWHPDRLARNSVDGGQIVYLLDSGQLGTLKFPSFWFENTSQGKFMLSIAFGQSKYYVDNLSENTKRGLRQKVRRGERPGLAPVGYINDVRTKTVVVDKRRSPIVIEAFGLYAKGNQRLEDIASFLASKGILTKSGKQFPKDKIKRMLTNPFYYGHFRYFGEIHEGKHTAIISKKLFDEVQATLAKRGRPQKGATAPQIFCGLLRCATCNLAITAEKKVKHQKNGNIHEYVYYRCTRKHKTIRCTEPAVTEPELATQLTDILHSYAIPKSWAEQLETMLAADEKKANQSSGVFVANAQTRLASLQGKLQRLLDGYLDQDIEQSVYRAKQAELMSEKKSLEEQVSKFTLASNSWVEPMRQWLKQAYDLNGIAESGEHSAIKSAFLEMDGLKLFLKTKKAQPTAAPNTFPPKNIWLLLRKAKENTARMSGNSEKSFLMVPRRGLEPPRA
ncbi:recombinase family protein [Candidatus Saccharibacteria bacterium]|nr:recombinase family protein [Candidatus Saccharibacteria bacterium]